MSETKICNNGKMDFAFEPSNDNQYAIMKYIAKWKYIYISMVNVGDIINNSRSSYPRLKDTKKRGRPGFFEMNMKIFNLIMEDPYFNSYKLIFTQPNLPFAFNFSVLLEMVSDKIGVADFQIVVKKTESSIKCFQNNSWFNSWPYEIVSGTRTYNDFIKNKMFVGTHQTPSNDSLTNSETIINFMDNLDMTENDYKSLLKYIINKI
jgi:hypothetical protein